jgi:hypothetical protein
MKTVAQTYREESTVLLYLLGLPLRAVKASTLHGFFPLAIVMMWNRNR